MREERRRGPPAEDDEEEADSDAEDLAAFEEAAFQGMEGWAGEVARKLATAVNSCGGRPAKLTAIGKGGGSLTCPCGQQSEVQLGVQAAVYREVKGKVGKCAGSFEGAKALLSHMAAKGGKRGGGSTIGATEKAVHMRGYELLRAAQGKLYTTVLGRQPWWRCAECDEVMWSGGRTCINEARGCKGQWGGMTGK